MTIKITTIPIVTPRRRGSRVKVMVPLSVLIHQYNDTMYAMSFRRPYTTKMRFCQKIR